MAVKSVSMQSESKVRMAANEKEDIDVAMPRPGLRPRCFFDIEIVGQTRGRVVFELFADICPKTCDNFRALCSGEMGISKISGKPLHFKGAPFHRIVKNFMIQGGDFTSGDGTGGESMYGKTFPDESFELNHDRDMLLSMANRGKDTNGSQFFITTQPAPHLDGIHVVFGQVLQGQALVKQIENQKVDSNSRPYNDVIIVNCGELVPQKRKSRPKKRKPSVSLSEDTSSSESESSSDSDSDTSDSETDSIERMKKQRRKAKKLKVKRKLEKKGKKKKKKLKKRGGSESEEDGRLKPKYHSTVRPDEIPDIPRPRFLYRGSPQRRSDDEGRRSPPPRYGRRRSPERVPYNSREFMSKSGRRIKGRGTIRYRTPTRSSSRERSATPPHWRREQEKLRHLDRRARFAQDDDRWLKGDKLRGTNQQGNTIISRKLRAQMAESFRRGEYDDDEIPRPGKPRSIDLGSKADARLERKLRRKEKKLKKKLKKEKKHAKKRRKQQGSESEVDVSSPEPPMYREPGRQRQPGPVSMSPMHTDPRSRQQERELEWEREEVEFSRSRQIKSPSVSDGSPPIEQSETNGRNGRSRSLSPLVREEDPYGGKKGMKSFQIKTSKKEPKVLKDDGKRTMFQDQSSSERSSRSRSPSPKRRSRFEEAEEELSPSNPLSRLAKIKPITMEPTAPAMVSVLPRGDSESPPPTHWKPGQKTWRPKREIIRKEIERRLRTVGTKKDKDPELPRTRSPSPEDEIMSASSEQSGDDGPLGDPMKFLSNIQGYGSLVPPGGENEHSRSPGLSWSGLVKHDQPQSSEPEPLKVKKALVSKWEPPEEPDDGEIIEEPDGMVQLEPPAKVFLIKTPPLPDISQIAVENQLILRKSDIGGAITKSNLPPKVSASTPMVPRNIAMAQKSQSGQLQKSPGHVPKPPSTPPRTPAEASRPPLPIQPPLPISQPPKPPGLPVPPKLPPRPPAEPPKPSSGLPTRLHGLPPKPLAERIGALPQRPTSRNMRTRPRSRSKSRSRSRSYSRSRSRSGRLTPPHRRRSYSHSSRSYSRSVSRSPRRRHSYSRSTSRSKSRSPRRSRDRYRRSRTTSTSRSRSPGGRRDSRSVSRSYSRSSRSYSRSRSRSHSPRRRRYSSDSYSN
ncbi:peptidyl-prolyl cis-trans isomerase G-like isoform X2 [Lineus longissimus]|uniref:peptidyl-prolyl cis-trans isomerase G-like isoform X2 n=1 Tax=Lineus longissimus TaxID=88925 RepID=UPI00315DAEE8